MLTLAFTDSTFANILLSASFAAISFAIIGGAFRSSFASLKQGNAKSPIFSSVGISIIPAISSFERFSTAVEIASAISSLYLLILFLLFQPIYSNPVSSISSASVNLFILTLSVAFHLLQLLPLFPALSVPRQNSRLHPQWFL